MTTYADSGVDIDVEEQAAKLMYEAARQTWEGRKGKLGEVIVPFDDFSGIRAINVGGLPAGTMMNIGFDGVGTKAEIAMLASKYDTLAYDLVAMVCDDAVVRGAEPVLLGSILDTNTLGTDESRLKIIQDLAKGYVAAANEANVAIINGEVAQLGDMVGGGNKFGFNWGSALVWFAHKDKMITGHKVKAGDSIVALREPGFRSNGFSLLRKVLNDKFGSNWKNEVLNGQKLVDLALAPSVIYSSAICDMFGGASPDKKAKVDLHAVAHITGSGIPGKLGRALKPSGLGVELDDLFEPSPLMHYLQEVGNISDEEAYRTWNMGQGMLIVTPEPDKAIEIAKAHNLEAKIAGKVIVKPEIVIANQGLKKPEKPKIYFSL